MADHTINYWFSRDGVASPASSQPAELSFQLNRDMEIEEDEDDGVREDQVELQLEDVAAAVVEGPPLESTEHERFAETLRAFRFGQASELERLEQLLVKHDSHLHVLYTVKRQDQPENKTEWKFLRRERDTWILLELLRQRREAAVNRRPGLTDRQALDNEYTQSTAIQLLNLLVRWTHLIYADHAPPTFLLQHSEQQEKKKGASTESLGKGDERAQLVWDLIRAGALYFVREGAETEEMTRRLGDVLRDSADAWRLASLLGGKPYRLVGHHDRIGNPHRATWKHACRALAQNKDASKWERAIYSIISGLPCSDPSSVDEIEFRVWSALRCLAESWSDQILKEYHKECKHSSLGRSQGEADAEMEDRLQPLNNDHILQEVIRIFEQAHSRRLIGVDPTEEKRSQIFIRMQSAMLTSSLDVSSLDKFISQAVATNDDGSVLRFFANVSLYFSLSMNHGQETILTSPKIELRTLQSAVSRYCEFLLDSLMIREIPPYVFVLEQKSRLSVFLRCMQALTRSSDNVRREVLEEIAGEIVSRDEMKAFVIELSSALLQSSPNQKMASESADCAKRRRQHIHDSFGESELWGQMWTRIELFRWTILLLDVVTLSSAKYTDMCYHLMLQCGNELVRRSIAAYLGSARENERILEWKLGEVVLEELHSAVARHGVWQHEELAEFKCWRSLFAAWKCVVMLEVILEDIVAKSHQYDVQIKKARDEARRELMSQREVIVLRWVSEEVNAPDNLCFRAKELRESFESALTCPFPPQGQDSERLALRNDFVGKIMVKCFEKLDAVGKEVEKLLFQISRAGIKSLHEECIKLAHFVTLEMSKRLRDGTVTDEFRLVQVKSCLEVVESAFKMLLRKDEPPFDFMS